MIVIFLLLACNDGDEGPRTATITPMPTPGADKNSSTHNLLPEEESTQIPLVEQFTSISAGYIHTCGVRSDGSVACWGDDTSDQAATPKGTFVSVSAGEDHTCGVKTDGTVACWGDDELGQATPPNGKFSSVSAGSVNTCGVRNDGSVACWGGGTVGESAPSSGEFSSVSNGGGHACVVKTDGSVACWGNDYEGKATLPSEEFASVSASTFNTCGVRADGSLACWGGGTVGESTTPPGEFSSVSNGGGHACGVKTDGSVACWGNDYAGQATPPSGEFASVSAGGFHTCGVRTNGSVACWGGGQFHGQSTLPWEEFDSVSCDNKIRQSSRAPSSFPPSDVEWPPGQDLSGIEFSFEAMSGETVEMRLTKRNVTDRTVRYETGYDSPSFFIVAVDECRIVWNWPRNILLPIIYRELKPHEERVWFMQWERVNNKGEEVDAGEYLVYASYSFHMDDWSHPMSPAFLSTPHKIEVTSGSK